MRNVELRSAFVTMVKTTDTRPRYNVPSPWAAHSPFWSLLPESAMGAAYWSVDGRFSLATVKIARRVIPNDARLR